MFSHMFLGWSTLQCFSASMLSQLVHSSALNPCDATMAFRLTYRRQCRYNTKRNKQHLGQSYGGEGGGVVIFDPHWTHIRLFYFFFV